MVPLVSAEVGADGKAFPTLGALEGPLPSVDPLMREQVGALAEALPTVGALEGPLPCVRPAVLGQC